MAHLCSQFVEDGAERQAEGLREAIRAKFAPRLERASPVRRRLIAKIIKRELARVAAYGRRRELLW